MNKQNPARCFLCYEMTDDGSPYHAHCLKKLFGAKEVPELAFSEKDLHHLALEYIKEKRGLPGVQKKLSLSLIKPSQDVNSRLTIVGYLGGHYILKPPTDEYPHMPEIEDLTMHLAQIAGIVVAPHGLIKMHDGKLAYITKRFDRKAKKKIAVEDLCQLSLKMTEEKYRSSSENVGKVIKKYSSNPGDDALKYFELVLFSFIVGNADMHLKNFSLMTEEPNNIRFAPAYDLLATKLLISNSIDPEDLALPINGKKSNLRKKDFLLFSKSLHIPEKVANYTFSKMGNQHAKWEDMINRSFISDELKIVFKKLIIKNLERIA